MRFPFQDYEIPASPIDGATVIFRPEIPLHLIGETGDLYLMGLLDTGADGVVMSRAVADDIGVCLIEGSRWSLGGLGNHRHEAMLGHVDVELLEGSESSCWRMPVGVVDVDDPEQNYLILLGWTGFLEHFDLTFLGQRRCVELHQSRQLLTETLS